MFILGHICNRPLLEDKETFPDSSFTVSASSDHSASDARISSGSSWCAPVSADKHYLQVDLGRLYVIYNFVTFGDSTSPKWVITYNLNYTVDLMDWRPVYNVIITFQANIFYNTLCGGQQRYNNIMKIFVSLDIGKQKCLQ